MGSLKRSVALVGLGEMGLATLGVLADHAPDLRFVVVDRSEQALAEAATVAGDDRVVRHRATVDPDQPLELPEVDLVLNLAGPFYLQAGSVARGAMAHGVPYVDICDDVEGVTAILGLDGEAKQRGVTLLTGAGGSPGLTNLMAARLLREHDADGVRVVWATNDPDPGGLAPLKHMLHMTVAPAPVWRNGKLVDRPGFDRADRRRYELPAGLGSVTVFNTAHPEPVTLGRAHPHLSEVSVQGALLPQWANDAFGHLGRLGFADDTMRVTVNGTVIDPAEVLWRLLWARHGRRNVSRRGYCVQEVIGLRGGEEAVALRLFDDDRMARVTAIGAAAITLQVLDEPDLPAGAWGPEVLDAEAALARAEVLAERLGAFPQGFEELAGPRTTAVAGDTPVGGARA